MATLQRIRNLRTADQWAELIKSKWQDSVQGIMDVGIYLSNAHEELGASAFWMMVQEKLKWAKGTVSKLEAIGTDPKLLEVSHGKLPAAWATLYALARLTDEQFERGLESGVIHAGMERKDIALLKPPKEGGGSRPRRTASPLPIDHPIQGYATEIRTTVFGWLNELPFDDWKLLLPRLREELTEIERELPNLEEEMREEGKAA